MKWSEGFALLLCCAALLVLGFGLGSQHQAGKDSARIVQAESKVASAAEDTRAARATVADVQARLDQQKRDLQTARFIANAALDARDALQKHLDDMTAQRTAEAEKAARESPDCADLRRLPICPAVAEQLFGAAPAAAASAASGH
ncbi:hypothetical protein [Fulvimonas yonginensis]|uniref:Uncharacterized protein n=1 Tax=Fulvimonas yonginensis TaxID=1495200 RepID=A0ABU8JB75_9GAMM